MRENAIEKRLRQQGKLLSLIVAKWTSPGNTGVPDDIVIWPSGQLDFVELKTTSGKLSAKQVWWLNRLTARGQTCYVIKGPQQLQQYLTSQLAPWTLDPPNWKSPD